MEMLTSPDVFLGEMPIMWETWLESEINEDLSFTRKNHLVKYRGRHSLREARLAEIEMAKSIDAPILFNNTKLKNLDKRQVQVTCPFSGDKFETDQLKAISRAVCDMCDIEEQALKIFSNDGELVLELTGVMPRQQEQSDTSSTIGSVVNNRKMGTIELLNLAEKVILH